MLIATHEGATKNYIYFCFLDSGIFRIPIDPNQIIKNPAEPDSVTPLVSTRRPASDVTKPLSQQRRQGHSRLKIKTPIGYDNCFAAMSDHILSCHSFDLLKIIKVKVRAGF